MKTLNFEQMREVNGCASSWAGRFWCGFASGGVGAIWGSAIGFAIGGPAGAFLGSYVLSTAIGAAAGATVCANA